MEEEETTEELRSSGFRLKFDIIGSELGWIMEGVGSLRL
jgi:hypothetical protein